MQMFQMLFFSPSSRPTLLPHAKPAAPIRIDRRPSAVTQILFDLRQSPLRDPRQLLRDLLHLLLEAAIEPSRTVPTTACPIGDAALARQLDRAVRHPTSSPARPNRSRQALHRSTRGSLARPLTGIHAVIVGEVAADHVGVRGGALTGLAFGTVGHVGGVLAIIDTDFAKPSFAVAVGLVGGFRPVAAGADALWGGSGVSERCMGAPEDR